MCREMLSARSVSTSGLVAILWALCGLNALPVALSAAYTRCTARSRGRIGLALAGMIFSV